MAVVPRELLALVAAARMMDGPACVPATLAHSCARLLRVHLSLHQVGPTGWPSVGLCCVSSFFSVVHLSLQLQIYYTCTVYFRLSMLPVPEQRFVVYLFSC